MIDHILELLYEGFVFFPWSKKKRDRRKEWLGTVEAKKIWAFSKHPYLVIFRTGEGQMKRVRLDRREDFDGYEEGLRYLKRVGQDLPDPEPVR